MTVIVDSVRAALEPLIASDVITDVTFAGVACSSGQLTPILSVAVADDHPERHVLEISRLIQVAGLDVEWSVQRRQAELPPDAEPSVAASDELAAG